MAYETIALAAGGTGGHVSPALALAEALQAQSISEKLCFLGGGREGERLIKLDSLEFINIAPPPLRWQAPIQTVCSFFKSVGRVLSVFKQRQIRAVVATGGYACLPVLVAAKLTATPYWLLEQNQIPGRVVRLFATGALAIFGPRGIHVEGITPLGVPVRQEVIRAIEPFAQKKPEEPLNIIVSGGSQGSQTLDERVPPWLTRLSESCALKIIHYARAETSSLNYGQGVDVQRKELSPNFVQDLSRAHVMVGRAGGSTVAECNTLGIPQILIPLPWAQDNHQWHNAQKQAELGAALVLEEHQTQDEWMAKSLKFLQPGILAKAYQSSQALSCQPVASTIAQKIIEAKRDSQ